MLGASIYLDKLSEVIRQQMDEDEGWIFYSFDHTGLVALIWDRELIFFEPRKSGDEAWNGRSTPCCPRNTGL